MKKLIILGTFLVVSAAIMLSGWDTIREVGAKITDFLYDDPDMPSFLHTDLSKEEFMERRSEGIALKRGLSGDKPFDPKQREDAVREMDRQEAARFELPASRAKTALLAAWSPIGPAPIPNAQVVSGASTPASGRTVAIAVHPTNPNIVYVGTAQGGLYRTLDGGTTWTPLLDNALSLAISSVAIAPSQPDTVFVGTGESGFCADCFFGVGIYRIDNASTAPTITGPIGSTEFLGRTVSQIVVHPTNPNIIFATSSSGVGGIGGVANNNLAARGVFRSTNALDAMPTLTKLNITGLAAQDRAFVDMVMDPGNPDLVLVTEADSFALGEGGVYRSTDAVSAPSPTFARTFAISTTGTDGSRTELTLNRTGGVVTVFAASGFGGGTVQRSTDGGATWAQRIDDNFCSPQCFYDIAVAVDPTNANRLYLGGTGTSTTFTISTDGGGTFASSASGLHTDSHVIAIAPSSPSTVYFGSEGGIYRSTDSGATWTSLSNATFSATQFMSIAVHPTDPKFTIGGTQDNGTNQYDATGTWSRVDSGDGGFSLIDQNAVDTTNVRMYHTYYNSGGSQVGYATRATTGGGWSLRGCFGGTANNITCDSTVLFYAPLEQGPGSPNTVYFGSDRLYRSADAGTTHTTVSQVPIESGVAISAIGISPVNDNIRVVGLRNGGLYGTTTGSSTLTNLDPNNNVPASYIARVAVDPNVTDRAYATLSAFGVTAVWRTNNLSSGSPTWTAASTGLPQVPVSAFVIDPLNSNNLYAGTDIGVYASSDAGVSWTPLGSGLPRVAVFDMVITNIAPRKLRIATHGRGLWEQPLGTPISRADFDGDGRSDVSIFRGTDGTWWENRSTAGLQVLKFGLAGDTPVPGDYDGDGKTDIAIFRPDANPSNPDFYVFNSATSTASYTVWGLPGDNAVVGDYDGDGKADYSVWRQSDTRWYTLKSTGGFNNDQFGIAGDIPMGMDFDGDGRTNLAVYRPGTGTWYIARNTGTPNQNFDAIQFGISTDKPVPADYDGDNKDDIAVYRNGVWYILKSSTGSVTITQFGLAGDIPVPGDYDGDGVDDIGVYRAGTWYINRSSAGLYQIGFGTASDAPVPAGYIP